MKRRLLTMKNPGWGLLAGLVALLLAGMAAVSLAAGWLDGEDFNWAGAIVCFGYTLFGSILVWSNGPALRARDRLAAGLCLECGYAQPNPPSAHRPFFRNQSIWGVDNIL